MFISGLLRLLSIKNSVGMKLLQLFSYCSLASLTKTFQSQFNTLLGQDGHIFDGVGWWSGLNKGGDSIYDVDIILFDVL